MRSSTALARSENLAANAYLFYRVGGQRNTYRISDAFSKESPEPHGRLDRAHGRRSRFRHAQMKWIIDFVGQHPVGFDHHQRVRGFKRNFDLRIVQVFQYTDMTQTTFHHTLGRRAAVLFQ